MRLLLALALAASLLIHLAVLFGTNIELLGGEPEPEPLQAMLRPLPLPAVPKLQRPPKKSVQPNRFEQGHQATGLGHVEQTVVAVGR
ncbi:MAG: hypothetical protein WAV95_14500, partial [Azonexus sp.]